MASAPAQPRRRNPPCHEPPRSFPTQTWPNTPHAATYARSDSGRSEGRTPFVGDPIRDRENSPSSAFWRAEAPLSPTFDSRRCDSPAQPSSAQPSSAQLSPAARPRQPLQARSPLTAAARSTAQTAHGSRPPAPRSSHGRAPPGPAAAPRGFVTARASGTAALGGTGTRRGGRSEGRPTAANGPQRSPTAASLASPRLTCAWRRRRPRPPPMEEPPPPRARSRARARAPALFPQPRPPRRGPRPRPAPSWPQPPPPPSFRGRHISPA